MGFYGFLHKKSTSGEKTKYTKIKRFKSHFVIFFLLNMIRFLFDFIKFIVPL